MIEPHVGRFLSAVLQVVTFGWLFIVFWFLMLGVSGEIWNLLVKLAALRYEKAATLAISPLRFLVGACVIIILASLYGLYEGGNIQVREVVVPTARLKPHDEEIRIVQLSDIHLGVTMPTSRLRRVADIVHGLQPDVIVDTGDLIDHNPEWLGEQLAILNDLDAPMGKYAVTGNHEFYVGLEESIAAHEKTGFELLRGRYVNIDNRLILAGVDDPTARRVGIEAFLDESSALPVRADNGPPVVFLKHQPDVQSDSSKRFDLQLSGHIHNGQVWPFRWFVKLQFDYGVGTHELPGGSRLIVSPGTGTWAVPIRVAAPPKVMLIRLVPEKP